MRSDHSSKCFRDGHYHMMSRERKIFVISWHASFMFYKEKSNNNYSLGSELLIHLSNVTLKKNRYFYKCFSYYSNINYQSENNSGKIN